MKKKNSVAIVIVGFLLIAGGVIGTTDAQEPTMAQQQPAVQVQDVYNEEAAQANQDMIDVRNELLDETPAWLTEGDDLDEWPDWLTDPDADATEEPDGTFEGVFEDFAEINEDLIGIGETLEDIEEVLEAIIDALYMQDTDGDGFLDIEDAFPDDPNMW